MKRLHTLNLKWMQYDIGSNSTMDEHLRAMGVMVRDLKTEGQDILEEELVLNVI